MAELERGHQDVVASIQCLAYTIGPSGISEEQARSRLETALLGIARPVKLNKDHRMQQAKISWDAIWLVIT